MPHVAICSSGHGCKIILDQVLMEPKISISPSLLHSSVFMPGKGRDESYAFRRPVKTRSGKLRDSTHITRKNQCNMAVVDLLTANSDGVTSVKSRVRGEVIAQLMQPILAGRLPFQGFAQSGTTTVNPALVWGKAPAWGPLRQRPNLRPHLSGGHLI